MDKSCGCGVTPEKNAGRLPPHCQRCHFKKEGHHRRLPGLQCEECTDSRIVVTRYNILIFKPNINNSGCMKKRIGKGPTAYFWNQRQKDL